MLQTAAGHQVGISCGLRDPLPAVVSYGINGNQVAHQFIFTLTIERHQ
jgi:hypothetical protein